MNNVIIFPTDTVYGIGCKIFDKEGIDLIYKIKHRDKSKPLAILCANILQIEDIAYVDERIKKVINKFLPGPLTLILKAKENIKKITNLDTIGVRIPDAKLALEILLENGPMFVTSVNESGEESLDDYDIIYKKYHDKVKKIYPKTNLSSHLPSSVVDFSKYDIIVLREGAITKDEILACLGGENANC